MKVWNDCPMCGEELIPPNHIDTFSFHCVCGQYKYGEWEVYIFKSNYVCRDHNRTSISFKKLDIKYVVPFIRFNSDEKIEKLLLLA